MGDDGLTDVEREELAERYRTTGAGRPLTAQEREAFNEWRKDRPSRASNHGRP